MSRDNRLPLEYLSVRLLWYNPVHNPDGAGGTEGGRRLSKPFDATTRELLETFPKDWLRVLLRLDVQHVSVLDSDLSTITSEADKVLRIDDQVPWLIHFELQSGTDRTLPLRLQRYNLLLHVRHELPVQSVTLLLRREADTPALTGLLQHRLPDGRMYHEFRYDVVRLWEMPVEQILAGDIGVLPLAPLSRVATPDLPRVFRRMGERLEAAEREVVSKIWTATYLLMGLSYPGELIDRLFEEVGAMEESITYQKILRRGRIEEARQILMRVGRKRFGPPDEAVVATIQGLNDLEQVETLAERLLDVANWKQLLAETTIQDCQT